MRIAYIINSMEGGGAAFPVPAVTRLLRAHGASVEVFALTRRDGRAIGPIEAEGLKVHVRDGGEKDHLEAFGWLRAEMRKFRPDLLWTSLSRATLIGQIVGRGLGAPVVSWQHAAYLKRSNRMLLRATQRSSSLWIADSHSIGALTAERLSVPAERLAVWPLFAVQPDAPLARPWRPGEPIRIGTLGRLHPVKGHDVLIDALVQLQARSLCSLPAFEVRIAGDGAEKDKLEAAITAAGLVNVRLTGFETAPQHFLSNLHLYVQPSRSEGLCISVHEAMQAGLPSIVSAVGELPYSVRDGVTGLVVPPEDPAALSQALCWMLTHPGRLAEMGAAARARALERFGAAAFARAGAEVMARLPVRTSRARGAVRSRSPRRPACDLSF